MVLRYSLALLLLLSLASSAGASGVQVSADGRYFTYRGETRLIFGESATQSVLQDANLDWRAWLDDLEQRGVRAALVWLFMAPRQEAARQHFDSRYGYAVPALMPWPRTAPGRARDGGPRYDLTGFDPAFWNRLRDLCAGAEQRGILLLITLFDGWSKDFIYHPLNQASGGIWPDRRDGRDAIAQLFAPDREVAQEVWDPNWPAAKRNQWIWERLAVQVLEVTQPFDNVFYELYNEGSPGPEWAAHFRRFLKARSDKPLGHDRDPAFDFVTYHVAVGKPETVQKISALLGPDAPPRPLVITETMPAYLRGASLAAIRRVVWGAALSGQHVFVQNDGVFRFDPHAAGSERGAAARDLVARADQFFQQGGANLPELRPSQAEVRAGQVLVLADSHGSRYAYSWAGRDFVLDLGEPRSWRARWYDVRAGTWSEPQSFEASGSHRLVKPDAQDWALSLQGVPSQR
jgi:hypothetical protein